MKETDAELHQGQTILAVSSQPEDHARLAYILGGSRWSAQAAMRRKEALVALRSAVYPVVISERDLPDGDWKDVLHAAAEFSCPPRIIVISRLADERLWGEVLNLGGYDVLAKPLDRNEVILSVSSAWRHWAHQHRNARRASASAQDGTSSTKPKIPGAGLNAHPGPVSGTLSFITPP